MKAKRKSSKLLMGMTAVMLVATPIYGSPAAHAAAATTTPPVTAVSKVIKPIYISSRSYVNLVDVGLSPSDDGQIATYTLSIYNGDTTTLDLTNYWFRLTSASGASYSLKTSAADANTTKVPAGSKIFITLYAKVGASVKLSDLTLKVVKFDFSVANYERQVGFFKLPSNFTNIVGPGSYKQLYSNATIVNSKVSSATVGLSGDYNNVTVNFVYNNIGKKAITLSNYKYYIVTAEGIMYEATVTSNDSDSTTDDGSSASGGASAGSTDLVLSPLNRTEIQLTAQVPASLKTSGWKLLIERSDGTDSAATTLAVGTYQLSFNNSSSSVSSSSFTYSNSEGKYQFDLIQLSRQPFESQDVLAARIRVKNVSTTALTVPTLSGYFYLDDKTKLNFKTVTPANQLALNANGYVDIDVYAKLPTNYTYSKAKLVVNNTIDKTTSKIGELSAGTSTAGLPIYAVDQTYDITRDGYKMSGVLNAVNVYNSVTTKIFSVQMTLTNDEMRTIDPVKLAGIFKSDNGDLFPATVTMADGKVNASNKALVTFSAQVPLNYDTNNLRLIVGEAVTDTAYTSGTDAAEGYVNAVTFNLPTEQPTNTTFKDVTLLPYQLTIHKLTPTVMGDNIQLTLDYDLTKDSSYTVYPTDRKLLLTIEAKDPDDGTEYTYFSQDLSLEGDSDSSSDSGSAASALQVGTDQEIELTKANAYSGIDGTLKYSLRLYEVVNGAKKLVAERPIGYWYLENDWNDTTTNS